MSPRGWMVRSFGLAFESTGFNLYAIYHILCLYPENVCQYERQKYSQEGQIKMLVKNFLSTKPEEFMLDSIFL